MSHQSHLLYNILSCHGTEPASELAECLIRFRCFFPSLLEVLEPATICMSCRFLPCLYASVMKSLLAFSPRSSCWFCSVGYLILIKLWRTMHASTVIWMVDGWWCIVVSKAWKRFDRMPNAFCNNPPGSRRSVIEDPLFMCKTTHGVWLHHVLRKAKRAITNKKVWQTRVVIRKRIWSREGNGTIFSHFFEFDSL